MFASGWYVFTLKDREVELEKAALWIEKSSEIIEETKKNQALLNNLKIDLNNATATKKILLEEIAINEAKLANTQLEEKEIIKYELTEHRGKMSASNIEIVKE